MKQLYVLCEIPPDSHAVPRVYELHGFFCPVCGDKVTGLLIRRHNHRVSSDLDYLMDIRSHIIEERRAIMKKARGEKEIK